ncbi:transcriptional repressor [Pontibacter sp. 13R65]|uniref:transcriptional repressor n=1 Tax=Pontibacter sp. 13R65 TaxID=3127458 RepID=UPI00301CC000
MSAFATCDTIRDFNLLALLEQNGLKETTPRLLVLTYIASRKEATSRACLSNALKDQVDRSTLFRLLQTFVMKNILQKVLDANGITSYTILPHHRVGQQQQMHFNCTRCNHLYYLQEHHMPAINLPVGFTKEFCCFITYGICQVCNKC